MAFVGSFISGVVGMVTSFVVGKLLYKKPSTPDATFSDTQTLVTTSDVVPMCYGQNLVHGAVIYSRLSNSDKRVHDLIALSYGECEEISDFKINSMDVVDDKSKFKSLSYNYYLGNNTGIDSRVTEHDPYSLVGGLKNITYVALSVTANENLATDFSIDVVLKGRKIWTPEGVMYSNNPAWVIRDFLTDENGCGLSEDLLDLDSFIDASNWYDIHDYTLNLKVNESGSAIDWLNKMTNACRSNLVFSGGKYSLIQDDIKPVSIYLDEDSINNLTVSWASYSDIPDSVVVEYVDINQEYTDQQAVVTVENPKREVPKANTVSLVGINTFEKAYEMAWYYLNKSVTCTQYIKFSTDARALQLNAMDVIAVSDYVCGFVAKQYQIVSITEKSEKSFVIEAREYNSDIFNEVVTQTNPVVNVVSKNSFTNSVLDALTEVETEQEYYVLSDGTAVSNLYLSWDLSDELYSAGYLVQYRKTSQEQWTEAGTFATGCTLNNLEPKEDYEISIEHVSLNGSKSNAYVFTETIEGNNEPPAKVKNLRAYRSSSGIVVAWDYNTENDLKYYTVSMFGSIIKTTTTNSVILDDLYKGVGVVTVNVVDYGGNKSLNATIDITEFKLGNVKDFNVSQSSQAVIFSWRAVEGADYYILKEGTDWSSGVLVSRLGSTTATLAITATNTSVNYCVKAFTNYGEESESPTYGRTVVSETISVNVLDRITPPFDETYFDSGSNSATMKKDLYFAVNEYTLDLPSLNLDYSENVFHKCRHWLDYELIPLTVEGTYKWSDLSTVSWNSAFAKSLSWIPIGSDYNYSVQNYVAIEDADKDYADYQEEIEAQKEVILESGSFCFQVLRTAGEFSEVVLKNSDESFRLILSSFSKVTLEYNGVEVTKDFLSCPRDKVFISVSRNTISNKLTFLLYSGFSQEVLTFSSRDAFNETTFLLGLNYSSWKLFAEWDSLDVTWNNLGYYSKSYRFYSLDFQINDTNFQQYLTPSEFGKLVPFLANDLNTDKVFVSTVCKRTDLSDSVPEFINFTHIIDVPDVNESALVEAVAGEGVSVKFRKEFHSIPSVMTAVSSSSTTLSDVRVVVTNITKSGCDVEAFDSTGASIEAWVRISISGY